MDLIRMQLINKSMRSSAISPARYKSKHDDELPRV